MKWIQLLIICFVQSTAECGSHSLEFLSTGRPHPAAAPQFEQLTKFDGVAISHCDSLTKREEHKPVLESKDFPDNCDEARFNIIESVHEIPRVLNSTVYVLQWRRGCSLSADGIISAFNVWAVNGADFISFDPESKRWTSKSPSAVYVEHRWNNNNPRNGAFSHFIKVKCPQMIQEIKLRSTHRNTEFRVFAKPIVNTVDRALLMCHVTTTDKSVSSVHLIGEGASQVSWTSVTGPLPSEDGSVIIRLTAGISISQSTNIGCRVQTGDHNMTFYWDGNTLDGRHLYNPWRSLTIFVGFCFSISVIIVGMISLHRLVKRQSHLHSRGDPTANREEDWNQWVEVTRAEEEDYYDQDYFANQVDEPL